MADTDRGAHATGPRIDDLITSVTIANVRQSEVGKLLDALRDGGFKVEINVEIDVISRP